MLGRSPDEPLDFCLSVRPRNSDLLVTLFGEVDVASAPAVGAMFAEAVTRRCRRVVIDASGVTFLDAAGLGALLAGPAQRRGDLEILVRAPSPAVRRVLELADLGRLVESSVASGAGQDRIA